MTLRKKLILILSAVAICPMIFVGLLGYFSARTALENLRMEQLKSITDLKVKKIEDFWADQKNHARIAQSREMGIIRFTISDGMILDNFPVQGTVNVNDTVLSSGLGRVYPPGLRVGVVSSVVRPELEPFCEITVTPFVNFHSLDELFVLRVEVQ